MDGPLLGRGDARDLSFVIGCRAPQQCFRVGRRDPSRYGNAARNLANAQDNTVFAIFLQSTAHVFSIDVRHEDAVPHFHVLNNGPFTRTASASGRQRDAATQLLRENAAMTKKLRSQLPKNRDLLIKIQEHGLQRI